MPAEHRRIVKLGLIGCGAVTEEEHLPALRALPNVQVAAVADLDATRLHRVAKRFRIPRRYGDHEQLLADADIDAVGVCIPAQFHAEVGLAALARGRPTLIEKPPGLSLDDVDRLIAASRANGVPVMVGYHMRWHRLVRQARAIVRSGVLGPVVSLRAVWYGPRDDRQLPTWRVHRELGGGALLETAIDQFDLWHFLLETEVEQVSALSSSGTRDDENAVLSGSLRSGVLVSAAFSERTSHEIEIEVCGRDARLRVSCCRVDGLSLYPVNVTPGSPRARLHRLVPVLGSLPRGVLHLWRGADYKSSYTEQWRHFVNTVRTGTSVACGLEDGRRALRVALAALESAASGRPVQLHRAASIVTSLRGRAAAKAGEPSGSRNT